MRTEALLAEFELVVVTRAVEGVAVGGAVELGADGAASVARLS